MTSPSTELAARFLLDVRDEDEWQAGHAPAAVHIELGVLASRLAELPRDRGIDVVCRSGGRSARATELLCERGFDAVNAAGGMQAWAAAGKPLVSENGAEPAVV